MYPPEGPPPPLIDKNQICLKVSVTCISDVASNYYDDGNDDEDNHNDSGFLGRLDHDVDKDEDDR